MLAMIPTPALAMIFLFPINDAYESYRKEYDEFLKEKKHCTRPSVHFFKQTISNACGMMAVLHSLANNTDIVRKRAQRPRASFNMLYKALVCFTILSVKQSPCRPRSVESIWKDVKR